MTNEELELLRGCLARLPYHTARCAFNSEEQCDCDMGAFRDRIDAFLAQPAEQNAAPIHGYGVNAADSATCSEETACYLPNIRCTYPDCTYGRTTRRIITNIVPQPSTATSLPAPSQEDLGQREVAGAAPDNLSYSGGGKVSVSVDSIVNSKKVQAQAAAVREIADAAPITWIDVQKRIDEGDIAGARALFNAGVKFVYADAAPDVAGLAKELESYADSIKCWANTGGLINTTGIADALCRAAHALTRLSVEVERLKEERDSFQRVGIKAESRLRALEGEPTEAMIQAGVRAFFSCDRDADDTAKIATEIYSAMRDAGKNQ